MLDRRSLPTYALILVLAVIGPALLLLRGFSIDPAVYLDYFSWPLLTIAGGIGLRRLGHPKFGGSMEVMGLLYWQGVSAFFCIVALASLPIPFADATLSMWDYALGFDWVAWAKATAWLHDPFAIAYKSFMWQPAMVAFALCLSGHSRTAWRAVFASTVALALATAIFALFPAIGSAEFYHFHPRSPAPPFHLVLIALKEGTIHTLSKDVYAGMISFPSYHATEAAIFSWACWKTFLRWPVLFLNILMAISAITMGSHYLVDILGGFAVACVSIYAAMLCVRSQSPIS